MDPSMGEYARKIPNDLHPDGIMAMESFDQAIKGIHENLQGLKPFLNNQRLACDEIVASLENDHTHSVSQDTLLAITASWDLYRKVLITAILDISKVSGVLMVEAIGAPVPYKRDEDLIDPIIKSAIVVSSFAVASVGYYLTRSPAKGSF